MNLSNSSTHERISGEAHMSVSGAPATPSEVLDIFTAEHARLRILLDETNRAFEVQLAALATKQVIEKMKRPL